LSAWLLLASPQNVLEAFMSRALAIWFFLFAFAMGCGSNRNLPGDSQLDMKKHDQSAEKNIELDAGQNLKVDARKPCDYPSYPSDCSLVEHFDFGWSVTCVGKQVTGSWSEHVMCNGQEETISFTCTYLCPYSAYSCAPRIPLPLNGADFKNNACLW
jgi:hypothetical protein